MEVNTKIMGELYKVKNTNIKLKKLTLYPVFLRINAVAFIKINGSIHGVYSTAEFIFDDFIWCIDLKLPVYCVNIYRFA